MIKKSITGLLLCSVIAFISLFLSKYITGIGSVSLSLIIGIIVGNLIQKKEKFNDGISFADKKLLPFTIALLGAELNFYDLLPIGITPFIFILLLILISFTTSILVGKYFGLSKNCSLLLGCGNAICGTSAIASASKILKSNESDTGLSIGAVNLIGTIGIFILPVIISIFDFNVNKSSSLIGGTLQAVGHVVASGYSVSNEVGNLSLIIKMTRVLMLGPTLVILSFFAAKNSSITKTNKFPVPLFIVGFFIMSSLSTFSLFPEIVFQNIKNISGIFLCIAMAGIGLKIDFKFIKISGPKIVIAEILIFAVQIFSAIFILSFLG